MKLPVY